MEKAALKGEIDRDKRAQYMASVIIVSVLGLIAYALFLGQQMAALVSGLLGIIVALSGVFSKQSQKNNDK